MSKCVCASNQVCVWVGMCVCVCHHQPNLKYTATYVCMYWKRCWKCLRETHPEICVLHAIIKRGHGCVYLSFSPSTRQLLVYAYTYMYVNTAELLQLHKAVILLLIMKYLVAIKKSRFLM